MKMSHEKRPAEHDPTGYKVTGYHVQGQEWDAQGRWVAADVLLRVPGMGRYLVHMVTKKQFEIEALEKVHTDLVRPEQLLEEASTEVREPFVLNDQEIDYDIILKKFGNREIAEDLAASMFYIDQDS